MTAVYLADEVCNPLCGRVKKSMETLSHNFGMEIRRLDHHELFFDHENRQTWKIWNKSQILVNLEMTCQTL